MASPQISQNLVPENPQLQDLLDLLKKDVMMSLACHHIGTVQSFDAAKQTATATINYKKTYFQRDSSGLYQPMLVDYPILIDCPCVVLGGGPTSLTFPIAKGDECLILFNDRDIDNWFSSGQLGPVATPRLHSMSDALILVGVRSSPKALAGYDTARAVLKNGTTKIGVGEDKIQFENAGGTLKEALDDLVAAVGDLNDAFKNNAANLVLVTGAPGNPSPLNPAIVTLLGAVTTALSQVGTKLGDLLE